MNSKSVQDVSSKEAYLVVLDFLKQAFRKGNRKVSVKDWDRFKHKLSETSLSAEMSSAVSFWTMENLLCHKPSRVQPRSLQEFEEKIFSGSVHSEFVEAVLFGMVSEVQCENILDEFLETSSQAVPPDRMLSSLSKMWARNIQCFQSVKVS
jgi:hypothetical protein